MLLFHRLPVVQRTNSWYNPDKDFQGEKRSRRMEKENHGFRIDPGSPPALVSMLCFAGSIPLLLLGYRDSLRDPLTAAGLVLPLVLSALMMIIVILKSGRTAVRLSAIPVFIGVAGFFIKLVIDPRGADLLHHVLAAVLYLAIIALWALTVLNVIRTKWVLVILFLIPFFKHLLMNDIPVLLGLVPPVSASVWLKEGSMLCFMLALSFCALSFRKT